MKFLEQYSEQAYALLRIVAGLAYLAHGVQKFFAFPAPFPYPLSTLLTVGGGIELVGGGLILVGLFTRPAAFIACGTTAVGYWVFHGTNGMFPIANGGETILLYCFIFLCIAARGAGIWSVDAALKKD